MLDQKSIDSLVEPDQSGPPITFAFDDAPTQLAAALALNEAAGRDLVRVNARCAELVAANASLVLGRDRIMEVIDQRDAAWGHIKTLQDELRMQSPNHHRQDGECVPDCEACRIVRVIAATTP